MKTSSNIWKYYLFEALWSLVFFFPIFQLFYLARELSITEIAFISVAFSISRVTLEIPSGVLADKWGRKKTLFLSQTLFIISMIFIIYSHSFYLFFIAAVIEGAWFATYSGTASSFLYDSLKEIKREKEYEKISGRGYLLTGTVGALAALGAGFLFNIDITLPYKLSIVTMVLSLVVISYFKEPKFHKPLNEENIFSHFKSSMKKVFNTEALAFIVIFGTFVSFVFFYTFTYSQIYFKLINIPVAWFGIIFALAALTEGLGGLSADKIKNKFSYRKIFSLSLLLVILITFSISQIKDYLGILLLLLAMFLYGMFRIIQRGYIHKRVESHNRATIESVSAFGIGIFAVVFEPIAGKIADIYDIQKSFLALGIVLLVYAIYYFTFKFNKENLFRK
ncbi:MAG: hypothetical protein CMH64_02305 [Nanoarchaeota archaeon]|nr:hypothetical protein [Nanoarchaeota archaeon]|tara:strand:- start:3166 stop:4344 length:1179 start_codon:yes stop_codon:yes gene_type:complete